MKDLQRRKSKPGTPWSHMRALLLRAPLWAVPFALFFGTLFGAKLPDYVDAYWASLIFSVTIMLCTWVAEWVLRPRLLPERDGVRHHAIAYIALYSGMAMLGSFIAAVILQFTIAPGFLGSARAIVLVGMFALLFVILVTGVMFALQFYRASLDNAKTEQELDLARRIQRSFLLSSFPSRPRLEMHAVNVSSKQVSGDFYDVVSAGDQAFWLAVADVSGKGVPAALLSSMLQASLRTQAEFGSSVSAVMTNINHLSYGRTPSEQFATFILARIDEAAMQLTYVNAGHNYPLLFRRGESLRTLDRGGIPVGFIDDTPYEEESFELRTGDRLVIYTDGITEAVNTAGEMFGETRLVEAIAAIPAETGAQGTTEQVLAAVRAFLGDMEPGDDMTVLVMRVLEPQSVAKALPPRAG